MVLHIREHLWVSHALLDAHTRATLTSMLVVLVSYAAFATTRPTLVSRPTCQLGKTRRDVPLGYGCNASTVAWIRLAERLLPYSNAKPRSECSTWSQIRGSSSRVIPTSTGLKSALSDKA